VTNFITHRALFSPIFLQSRSLFHERGSDNPRHFIRNFPNERSSVVGRSSIVGLNWCILLFATSKSSTGT